MTGRYRQMFAVDLLTRVPIIDIDVDILGAISLIGDQIIRILRLIDQRVIVHDPDVAFAQRHILFGFDHIVEA